MADDFLAAVARGLQSAQARPQGDPLDEDEQEQALSAKLDNDLKQAEINNINSDRELRETYAKRILSFLIWYSISVAILLVAAGLDLPWLPFELPDQVLIMLVGSTAAAAIGLVGFIARGLFKTPPSLSG